jgi:hypothetical protein
MFLVRRRKKMAKVVAGIKREIKTLPNVYLRENT